MKYFLDAFLLNAVYPGYIPSRISKVIIILDFCYTIIEFSFKKENCWELPEGGDLGVLHCRIKQIPVEAYSLKQTLNRYFWVGAIMGWFSSYAF